MEKRDKLSITLSRQLIMKMESERKLIPRSTYIENALRKYLRMEISGRWRNE